MKKKDFENRLQNDLFPEMPASFEAGLKKTMQEAGIQTKKRLSATGLFAGVVSVAAAAACLVIVLIGVLSGGRSQPNVATSGEGETTLQTADPAPETPLDRKGDTKVIALSSGFDFANAEKYEALYKGILSYLRNKGEAEPDELWLCAIKSRLVKEDTGYREDGYLDGYYVLAQHAFGPNEGPELYAMNDAGQVLWATEGSGSGPNHAVHPVEDSDAELIQRHFLYGTEPMIAEPGVPHVKRGAVVGKEPGTDIEFSMAASITEVQSRLAAADSAYPGAAREFFLVTVPASSWDQVMAAAHTLRFETEEGPVDVDMETELPTVGTVLNIERPRPTPIAEVQGVEYWLSQNQPLIRDFTDDWYGEEAVQQYAEAVRRALLCSGEHIHAELWICGVASDAEHTDGTSPASVYVLALNVGDGEPSPELFYYENGRVLWMTQGADIETVNVVYHNGNTIVFGKSPAFDNRPLAMTSGRLTLENGDDELAPVLPLEQIRQRITGGPYYYSARECYLWKDGEKHEIKKLTIAAEVDGKSKGFTLDRVNVLMPQTIPSMALAVNGEKYPGTFTHLDNSLYVSRKGENYYSGGIDVTESLEKLQKDPDLAPAVAITGREDWNVVLRSDNMQMEGIRVYTQQMMPVNVSDPEKAMELVDGSYYVCFLVKDSTPEEEYEPGTGKRAYSEEWVIYRVTVQGSESLGLQTPFGMTVGKPILTVQEMDRVGEIEMPAYDQQESANCPFMQTVLGLPMQVKQGSSHHYPERVLVYSEDMSTLLLDAKDIGILQSLPAPGTYRVFLFARRDGSTAGAAAGDAYGFLVDAKPAMYVTEGEDSIPGTLTHVYSYTDENGVSANGAPLMETLDMAQREPSSVPVFVLKKGQWQIRVSEGFKVDRIEVYDIACEGSATRVGGGTADGKVDRYGSYGDVQQMEEALTAGAYYVCFHVLWQGDETDYQPLTTRGLSMFVIYRVTVE